MTALCATLTTGLLAWISWEAIMCLARRQVFLDEVAGNELRESAIRAVERRT